LKFFIREWRGCFRAFSKRPLFFENVPDRQGDRINGKCSKQGFFPGINLMDYIVVGHEGFTSIQKMGLIPEWSV